MVDAKRPRIRRENDFNRIWIYDVGNQIHWNEHDSLHCRHLRSKIWWLAVVQFALRIAFRCVLHRYRSLDIHRWKFISFDAFINIKDLRIGKHSAIAGSYWHVDSRRTLLMNDPSAGSPTETLLRLLHPLNNMVCLISFAVTCSVKKAHQIIQSEQATGDVYILQGRNQHKLMTCAY